MPMIDGMILIDDIWFLWIPNHQVCILTELNGTLQTNQLQCHNLHLMKRFHKEVVMKNIFKTIRQVIQGSVSSSQPSIEWTSKCLSQSPTARQIWTWHLDISRWWLVTDAFGLLETSEYGQARAFWTKGVIEPTFLSKLANLAGLLLHHRDICSRVTPWDLPAVHVTGSINCNTDHNNQSAAALKL